MTTPASKTDLSFHRHLLPPAGYLPDANNQIQHPADRGAWIWHPGKSPTETAILRFHLKFSLAKPLSTLVHVTADQRFQLYCDGQALTFGPDRCDIEHWTVQSVQIELPAGEHEFVAIAWHIAAPPYPDASVVMPPMAQVSWQGGFLFYVEGEAGKMFNTGEAPWTVEDLTQAVVLHKQSLPGYHDIGPAFDFDLDKWALGSTQKPSVIRHPLVETDTGVRGPGWCLYPAALPEQRREKWSGGKIRALRNQWSDGPVSPEDERAPEIAKWQDLLNGKPLVIPPHSKREIFWDFENYFCGYPAFNSTGGKGSVVDWSWAEGLYAEKTSGDVSTYSHKHNRGEIENKVFVGKFDRWKIGGKPVTEAPSLWWRAGRYSRLRIETADEPLTLNHLGMLTTGFPFDRVGSWTSSDPRWNKLMPLFERAFQCAAHETWCDTPYYEQMCYVGDNVLCALSNYAWFRDARISRRSVQLYEWSRRASGFVAERYPSRQRQECLPFSMLWPTMVRDLAWWRNEPEFIKSMLPGLRGQLAEFEGILQDGLLRKIPGWPFVDWCVEWNVGCGPGMREGDSSVINLHWVRSLLATAQVEQEFGDPMLAERCTSMAKKTFSAIIDRYWDKKRGLLLDTTGQDAACEYAQAFALLTGLFNNDQTRSSLAALKSGKLVKATIYATYYVLETYYQHGESQEFHNRMAPWFELPSLGFTSTPEAPEPTRSDAHPWGAHPAWHALASVAGVRPAAAGFSKVRVAPCPGPLESVESSVCHPQGLVNVKLTFKDGAAKGHVELPAGVSGEFHWNGSQRPLQSGRNEIS